MERNYATQMDAARRGIVTPELKKVAEKEYMAVENSPEESEAFMKDLEENQRKT